LTACQTVVHNVSNGGDKCENTPIPVQAVSFVRLDAVELAQIVLFLKAKYDETNG